jgi:hypothetical protein
LKSGGLRKRGEKTAQRRSEMPIYDKSTNQLLTKYLEENLKPQQTIEREQIVKWFKKKYPKIKSNTVEGIELNAEDFTRKRII